VVTGVSITEGEGVSGPEGPVGELQPEIKTSITRIRGPHRIISAITSSDYSELINIGVFHSSRFI
jgi:hypothetical protein